MAYKYNGRYKKYQAEYYKNDKQSYVWRHRKNYYGLSKEDYYSILEKQDNKCALCKIPFTGMSSRIIHVDHDHETKRVRGLLCMPCNVALGMLGDNEEGLIKALKYVQGVLI